MSGTFPHFAFAVAGSQPWPTLSRLELLNCQQDGALSLPLFWSHPSTWREGDCVRSASTGRLSRWRIWGTACTCKTLGLARLVAWEDTRRSSTSSASTSVLFSKFCSLDSAFESLRVSLPSLRTSSDSGDLDLWLVSPDSFVYIWGIRWTTGLAGTVWRNEHHPGARGLLCRDEHRWGSAEESQAISNRPLWPFYRYRCSLHFSSWSCQISPGNWI